MKILVQLFWNNICSPAVGYCWSVLFFFYGLPLQFPVACLSLYIWLWPWRMTDVSDVWWNAHVCFSAKAQKYLSDFVSGDSWCLSNLIPAIFKKDQLLLHLSPARFFQIPPLTHPAQSFRCKVSALLRTTGCLLIASVYIYLYFLKHCTL